MEIITSTENAVLEAIVIVVAPNQIEALDKGFSKFCRECDKIGKNPATTRSEIVNVDTIPGGFYTFDIRYF